MSLSTLIQRIQQQPDQLQFDDVMAVIAEHYDYTPTRFSNGLGDGQVVNAAGQNEGSCKLFAFARLNGLDEAQTLACFGDYYRRDVLANPQGSDHANIRSFMRHGWPGIQFDQPALTAKTVV
jgi:hypothetical protein